MQSEDPNSQEDSTPPRGITPVRPGQGSPHVHFWSDVTIPGCAYVEEVCNGEKWSPLSEDYVFPRGCGARRRIHIAIHPALSLVRSPYPSSSAWEIVEPGKA